MKKKEMREVIVTYCDYCGKEIRPPYSSIEYQNGKVVDLCSDYIEDEKSCFDKYKDKNDNSR